VAATFEEWFRAALAGAVCGFVVSVPVGPVNLTVIHTALRRGFLAAFLAGAGAVSAELIYAGLMLAGHSTVLVHEPVALALRGLAVVVIAAVGVRSLLVRSEELEARSAAQLERADARWHHPRSFLLGFMLTISNLLLLLLWATLTAALYAHDWVRPGAVSRGGGLGGVAVGAATWCVVLAFFVSRAHRRVQPRTLAMLVRGCGLALVILAGGLAWRLVATVSSAPVTAPLGRDGP
jgi:threonine/homoserine/homoserine lactone efflux protein